MSAGLLDFPWWGYVLALLGLTHITIAAVTIYLHRNQAHRALDLHPLVSHFFRFWLWTTTGMTTKEWVAVHRKHHAKVETPEDPHSPRQVGINKVLWGGVWLYHEEASKKDTLEQYGHGTPADWMERNVYTPYHWLGVVIMLGIDILLFGIGIGILIWIVQMVWIPFWAAGVINGIGHYWGYRNYEVNDTSTNIIPFGLLIGGEELHNNHHTYPSSAKFSNKWWEFDVAWLYIRLMQAIGLAKVKKVAPKPAFIAHKQKCDLETVRAVVRNRFQVMSRFAREVVAHVYKEELKKVDRSDREHWHLLKRAKQLLVREPIVLNEAKQQRLQVVLEKNSTLQTVYKMKQKLQDIWHRGAETQEQLIQILEDWCKQAEATGIQALKEFSARLRTYTLAATPT